MPLGLNLGLWMAGMGGGSVPELPATGLISEWRFSEGAGTTVADSVGANAINLSLPTSPNFTWQSYGVSLAAGLIQTPSIASHRTIAFLYRVGRGETSGFQITGNNNNGNGMQGDFIQPTWTWHGASGQDYVAPLKAHTNGAGCRRTARGGWLLVFAELPASITSPVGFGGRFNTTTNRCTDYEIMWAACWSGQLTSQDRTAVYGYVRNFAKLRGKPIHYADFPVRYDCVLLRGQSNADGNALVADLSGVDQARSTANTVIAAATTSITYPPAALQLGVNQRRTNQALFGPEMGAAWAHEDTTPARKLGMSKTGVGSSWLVATSSGLPANALATWNPGEVVSSCLFWSAMQDWWDFEQHSMVNNVGPRLRAVWYMQGEQDATDATLVASGAYQANLQALYDSIALHSGAQALKIIIGRIRNQDPAMNATAAANVRSAQAAFVSANPTVATLIDTDSFALGADNVHYNAVGMKALGQAFYAATAI